MESLLALHLALLNNFDCRIFVLQREGLNPSEQSYLTFFMKGSMTNSNKIIS